MDADKTNGEKAWRQLHNNAASNFEQDLEANPQKAAATYLTSRKLSKLEEPDMQDTAEDELISDVLQWTPSHGREKAGRPARTYIHTSAQWGYRM